MFSKKVAVAAMIATASPALAQTPTPVSTTATDAQAQTHAFQSILSTYSSSFKASPEYTGIAQNLFFDLPSSVLSSVQASPASLIPVPTGSAFDLHSFATNPPTSFPQLDWESYLSPHPSISSSIDVLRTSAVLALATSAQSVIGTTASIATPPTLSTGSTGAAAAVAAPTMPPGAGSAMGLMAGLLGAGAILL